MPQLTIADVLLWLETIQRAHGPEVPLWVAYQAPWDHASALEPTVLAPIADARLTLEAGSPALLLLAVGVEISTSPNPPVEGLGAFQALRQAQEADAALGSTRCTGCGCTEQVRCDGGCWWVALAPVPLCSQCAPGDLVADADEGLEWACDMPEEPYDLGAAGVPARYRCSTACDMPEEPYDLGPCCRCSSTPTSTIICLPYLAPLPGTGWGCVQCGLAADGAMAVVCEPCAIFLEETTWNGKDLGVLETVCYGLMAEGQRLPASALPREPCAHDMSKHPERAEEAP